MNRHFSTQATALGLAAFFTLGMLASIQAIATAPAPDAQVARIEGPASAPQVIEITAKRMSHV